MFRELKHVLDTINELPGNDIRDKKAHPDLKDL